MMKKVSFAKSALLILLLTLVFLKPDIVYSNTLTLQASADTYVSHAFWDETSPTNTNYGSEPYLITGHHGVDSAALIKFDLSTLPTSATINSATMNLFWGGGSSATGDLGFADLNGTWGPPYNYYGLMWKPEFQVHNVNTAWGENSVTFSDVFLATANSAWPNLPQVKDNFFDPNVLAGFSYLDPNITQFGWINLDVTDQAALWYSGQSNNGLILTSTGYVFSSFSFFSKESGFSNWLPTLTIDYTDGNQPPSATPEPATMLLLGLGLVGLAGFRRKLKK